MKKMSREKFLLAKKSDAKNERAKGKPLRWKHTEQPLRSEHLGLNTDNMMIIPKVFDSAPMQEVKQMTNAEDV